ncbi:MAG: TIGR00297 family protein [Pseudanabaenaceae cyanobacterium]
MNLWGLLSADPWWQAVLLNTILGGMALVLPRKALTTWGIIHAWFLGILLWGCLGWRGYVVMFAYLVLGTAVTYVGKDIKEAKGIAEKRSGARGPENLWGSAAVGALCAIGYFYQPHPLWLLGYVASVATKLADTFGSEIGKAYGKHTFLITDIQMRSVPAGTEGAVSREGLLASIIGSLLIVGLGLWLGLITLLNIKDVVVASFIAVNLESVLGATLQSRWQWLTNEVVNAINTAIGATLAVVFTLLFPNL